MNLLAPSAAQDTHSPSGDPAAMPVAESAAEHVPVGLPYDLQQAYAKGALLRVAVGSRLHGFSHAGSDYDYWVVVREPRDWNANFAARKVFQAVEKVKTPHGEVVADVTVVGLSTFMHYAANGVPQALEVLYAAEPEVDMLGPVRQAFRASPSAARESYGRMMKRIVFERTDDRKQRRHAFRMALNLDTLLRCGHFNPTLSESQKAWVLTQSADEAGFRERLVTFTGMPFESSR